MCPYGRVVITTEEVDNTFELVTQRNNKFQAWIWLHLAGRPIVVLAKVMWRHIHVRVPFFECRAVIAKLTLHLVYQWFASVVPKHQRVARWWIVGVPGSLLLPCRVTATIDSRMSFFGQWCCHYGRVNRSLPSVKITLVMINDVSSPSNRQTTRGKTQ